MKKNKSFVWLSLTLLASALLPSCASNDPNTIVIAASPTPHAVILKEAVKPLLEEKGYNVEIKELDDYITPNQAVEDGSAFANYFQHEPYLLQYNEEHNSHEVAICGVHYEPFGIFAGASSDLENVKDGATIGVPNDVTNEGRALALLEAEGLIEIDDAAGLNATVKDITSNPHNLDIRELSAQVVGSSVRTKDLDFGVVNGNYASQNELGTALVYEQASEGADRYTNVVAIKEGNEDDPRAQALLEAFQDPSVEEYINTEFAGIAVYNYLDADELVTDF